MVNTKLDQANIRARLNRLTGLTPAQTRALAQVLNPTVMATISDGMLAGFVGATLPTLPINPEQGLPLGLPGATESVRFVGGTTLGPPATGEYEQGDYIVSRLDGTFWTCITDGNPGNWVQAGGGGTGGGGLPLGLPGATADTRWVGGTASGAPTSGAFRKGDFVVGQDGTFWTCTAAGSPGTWQQAGSGGSGSINPSDPLIGAANGLATLDGTGVNQQAPLPHTHLLRVTDNGGTLYQPSTINLKQSGLLAYHSDTGVLDVDLTLPAPIRLRATTADTTRSVTNLATVQTVVSLTTPTLPANSQWDIYCLLLIASTTAAGAKFAVTGPSGSNMAGNFFAPSGLGAASPQTAFDTTSFRFTTINIPTNGSQAVGGFGDPALAWATARFEGSIAVGSTAGTVQVRFAQATATSGVTSALQPFHSKLFLFPA